MDVEENNRGEQNHEIDSAISEVKKVESIDEDEMSHSQDEKCLKATPSTANAEEDVSEERCCETECQNMSQGLDERTTDCDLLECVVEANNNVDLFVGDQTVMDEETYICEAVNTNVVTSVDQELPSGDEDIAGIVDEIITTVLNLHDDNEMNETFYRCIWADCTVKKYENEMVQHIKHCDKRIVLCKWPGCDVETLLSDHAHHEEVCEKRLIVCKWRNCNIELSRVEIEKHVEKCGERMIHCKWPECCEKVEHNVLDEHQEMCRYRDVNLVVSDCWICGRFAGDYYSMLRHLNFVHSDNVSKCSVAVESLFRGEFWQDFYKVSHGELLRCVSAFSASGEVKFYAERYGRRDDDEIKFVLTVELFHPKEREMETLKVQGDCSDFDGISNFIKIDSLSAAPYVYNGQIYFFHRIVRI